MASVRVMKSTPPHQAFSHKQLKYLNTAFGKFWQADYSPQVLMYLSALKAVQSGNGLKGIETTSPSFLNEKLTAHSMENHSAAISFHDFSFR